MILDVLSEPGRFVALADDHPGVGRICPGCDEPLTAGQRPALVNGIPADAEEAAKADAGRVHIQECQLAHEACAFPAVSS